MNLGSSRPRTSIRRRLGCCCSCCWPTASRTRPASSASFPSADMALTLDNAWVSQPEPPAANAPESPARENPEKAKSTEPEAPLNDPLSPQAVEPELRLIRPGIALKREFDRVAAG